MEESLKKLCSSDLWKPTKKEKIKLNSLLRRYEKRNEKALQITILEYSKKIEKSRKIYTKQLEMLEGGYIQSKEEQHFRYEEITDQLNSLLDYNLEILHFQYNEGKQELEQSFRNSLEKISEDRVDPKDLPL